MLKLEKKVNSSKISVRFREKEVFFDRRLCLSFAIAFAFHGALLLLFHITPYSSSSSFIFLPIEVASDVPASPSSKVSAQASLLFEDMEEAVAPLLTLIPTLDWNLMRSDSILTPSFSLNFNAMQELEERVWPKWVEPLHLDLEEPRIQLFISGDLSAIPMIGEDPLLKEKKPVAFGETPATLAYQVLLDTSSGEIFWYELIESNAGITLQKTAEKILLNVRFATVLPHEHVNGILNFVINE